MFDKFQVWVKMVKMGKMVNMVKMGKIVNWSRWARWSDTLTTLSAHTRAKRRSSWSFGAFQQPEPSLWQLGWCDIALLVDRSTKILHSSWRSRWMILLMIRNITIGNRHSYKNPESVPQLFSQNQPEENQQDSETNDKEQVWF